MTEEIALPMTKQYECLDCMFRSTRMSNWTAHLHTQKHRINVQHQQHHADDDTKVDLPIESRAISVYNCSVCNFKFCNMIAWRRHIQSKRHIKLTQMQLMNVDAEVGTSNSNSTSLTTNAVPAKDSNTELIQCLIEQYKELKETVLHQSVAIISTIKDAPVHHPPPPPPPPPIMVQNNFNLNFFLNDTCKDALNISEFIESVEINISDLLRTAEQGYVDGITNILLNRLNELEVHERPIHCTDSKRDIIYIKDKNCWEREEHDKPKLKNAIIQVSNKNIQPKIDTYF